MHFGDPIHGRRRATLGPATSSANRHRDGFWVRSHELFMVQTLRKDRDRAVPYILRALRARRVWRAARTENLHEVAQVGSQRLPHPHRHIPCDSVLRMALAERDRLVAGNAGAVDPLTRV